MFGHQAIWSKTSDLRLVSLRIGSLARDATDIPVPATTGGGLMVDRASGQIAIEVTHTILSTPDPMAAPRSTVVTDKQAAIAKQISWGKKKAQWQDVPMPLKSAERRKTGAKQLDQVPVSPISPQVEERDTQGAALNQYD
ncbi:hypothetical protein R1flu_004511 [Riccia fluitans]|uniref:Uncharacterized protein n=1 Tax=Riccia fluitans TaxID=41844 RepID=A0ABD1YQI2_9MARC